MSATPALAAAPIAEMDEPARLHNNESSEQTAEPTPAIVEQAETRADAPAKSVTEAAQVPGDVVVDTAHPTHQRDEAVARIRQSALPPAMRERLAAVVETGQSSKLDVALCLEAIEQTLPDFLRTNRDRPAQPIHPLGEAFFRGSEELTDAEAETLAQQQLARSGLLRGQRVKVGD